MIYKRVYPLGVTLGPHSDTSPKESVELPLQLLVLLITYILSRAIWLLILGYRSPVVKLTLHY